MKEYLEKYLAEYRSCVENYALELRNQPMPELTEEKFSLFEKTGNRMIYEEDYFIRRKYLAVYAMAYWIGRKEEDLNKLEEVIEAVCMENSWALPAHTDRKNNPDWRNTVDLFACETGQTLAELITIFQQDLKKDLREHVKKEVISRVLTPFYQSEAPCEPWEYNTNNWCAVCAGAIGSASIYLLKDVPEKCLERIRYSLTHYLKGFTDDGACMEGLAYFSYGMSYYAGFSQQYLEYSHGAADLMADEKIASIAEFQQKCYFDSGLTVSFSDGYMNDCFHMGLTCYLAGRFPNVRFPNRKCAAAFDSDSCYRFMTLYRDYIWVEAYLEKISENQFQRIQPCPDTNNSVHGKVHSGLVKEPVIFEQAQWYIAQSGNMCGMAAKGGNNAEHHNHNDVGSFLYLSKNTMLLADLGAGEYTKDYFSGKRYQILCNSSLGHNVPVINGSLQMEGERFACDRFEADKNGNVEISFGNAYDLDELDEAVRRIRFNRETGMMQIADTFTGGNGLVDVKENLVTRYVPRIRGNKVQICGGNEDCTVEIDDPDVKISYQVMEHKNHAGKTEHVFLIQWQVDVNDGYGKSKFRIYCK